MGHEITARDSMVYVGRKPWHDAGRPVEGIHCAEDAALAWTVSKRPLMAVIDAETAVPVPNRFATVRDDNFEALGVVGSTYQVIQNRGVFGIHDAMAAEGMVEAETAGSVKGGRRVWLASKLNGMHVTRRDGSLDALQKYLLFYNSHDGASAAGVTLTPIRVVCNNTLTAAIGWTQRQRSDNPNHISIWHQGNVSDKLKEAHRVLLESQAGFEKLGELYQGLEDERISMESFRTFADEIAAAVGQDPEDKKTEKKREAARRDRAREVDQLVQLFGEGKGNRGETKWDAYNALCEWIDHERTRYRQAKDAGKRAENHMASTVWGQSTVHKGHALKLLAKA